MPRIAISYRRTDSAGTTGRIHEKLAAHFGEDDVFIDLFKIPPAIDFRQHIRETISNSEVVLAIIGRHWVDGENRQRLNDPTDLVRIEIQTALEKLIPIIPVRVDEAVMPAADILPQEIRELVYRNGTVVSPNRDFRIHMESLIQSIDQILKTRDSQKAAAISAASKSAAADESQRGVATIDQLLHGPAFGLSNAPSDGSPRDAVRVLETEPVSLTASSSDHEKFARHDHEAPSRSHLADRHVPHGGEEKDDRYRVAPPGGDYEGDGYHTDDGQLPPPDKNGSTAVRRRGSATTMAALFGVVIIGGAGVIGYRAFISGSDSTTSPPLIASQAPPTKTESQVAKAPSPVVIAEAPPAKPFLDRIAAPADPTPAAAREEQPNALPTPPRNVTIVASPPAIADAPPASINEPKRVRTIPMRLLDGSDGAAAGQAARPPAGPQSDALTIAPPTVRPASGSYVVQVSAQRTEAEAQSSYRALQQKYPTVLGGREARMRRVELGDLVFYRAQIGPFTTSEQATAFCDSLKATGGQCIVQRN